MAKILVIDDSKMVRFYHRQILNEGGYEIDEAENGMEALEKIIDTNYALFLVDINMPVMDGYSFMEELRKKNINTPAIMISTEAESSDKTGAYSVGADLYFIKPVKPDMLMSSVKILTQ